MTYAIVYSSRTGNTEQLARALRSALPLQGCLYFGPPDPAALAAERLYLGFWTDRGSCDETMAAFLAQVEGKEVFLFGTAGFGRAPAYFQKVLAQVETHLGQGCTLVGSYMCQGRMPLAVRQRYEKMLAAASTPGAEPSALPGGGRFSPASLQGMIENFDQALAHPDADDLDALVRAARQV